MSTAYFIVLDSDDPGFDSFVDGKFLTRRLDAVNKLANALGLKPLDDFASQDLSEFGGPEMDTEWFDAQEGLDWASSLVNALSNQPNQVQNAGEVIADLKDYIRVFEEAKSRDLKWHLELDF